jgi:hypothetical protein
MSGKRTSARSEKSTDAIPRVRNIAMKGGVRGEME